MDHAFRSFEVDLQDHLDQLDPFAVKSLLEDDVEAIVALEVPSWPLEVVDLASSWAFVGNPRPQVGLGVFEVAYPRALLALLEA